MNIFKTYQAVVEEAVRALDLGADLDLSKLTVEPPRDASHGDMATNAALVLSKQAGKNPRELGEALAKKLSSNDNVEGVEVAGPGFVNFRLNARQWQNCLADILKEGIAYGDCNLGQGEKVNVEYVSANPTGPMHAGHVRGAVIGDCMANLLKKAGYDVTKEYYFNDAGTQVDVLAQTTYLRYREVLGEDIGEIPEGLYPGDYLKEVARALAERDGDQWLGKAESEWLEPVREFAVNYMMVMIREDLALIGIRHDVFTNERELIENGTLDAAFKTLDDMGLIYQGTLPPPKGKEMEDWEPVELTLFRTTKFGDDVDRPLKKRDGNWAYIMPDIAYHYDKIRRGFTWMINMLGKDHGGYQDRLRPAVDAFSEGKARLDVVYNGMVKMLKDGEPVKLSKRSGNLITLREMVEEVGAGAVRFLIMTRTPESDFEFDFTKAVEQSKDNPVFYVQYAHARCCSVLRHAADAAWLDASDGAGANLSLLDSPEDLAMIKRLASWPRMVEAAAEAHEPHRIAFFLYDVAAEFHALWNYGRENATLRFLIEDNPELSQARLALVKSISLIIASGLSVLGIEPAEEMHS